LKQDVDAVQKHLAKKRNAAGIYAVMHVKNAANEKNHATVQKNAQKNAALRNVAAVAKKKKQSL